MIGSVDKMHKTEKKLHSTLFQMVLTCDLYLEDASLRF